MSSVTVAYISASTNRHSHAAGASAESVIAFGSAKLIALWNAEDESDRGVYETLPGHDGTVTCVRYVHEDHLLSADDKGVLRCWRKNGSQWESSYVTQAHQKGISALAVHDGLVVSGASESFVKIWKFSTSDESSKLAEVQSISLRGKYPLSLAVTVLPGVEATILAIGSTDRNIQIWTRSEDLFVSSAVLSGHEDWVRSLSFRQPLSDADSLVLASGSQDATIRLWNIEVPTKKASNNVEDGVADDLLDTFEASLAELGGSEEGGRQISLKRHILTVKTAQGGSQQYSITFDALLISHEAGVTSLSWQPKCASRSTPTLLSTSTDSSLILWSPSTILTSSQNGSTSIWINRQRFGDIGGQRLGGFVGGLWARGGTEVLAWGWSGGWRRWRCTGDSEDGAGDVQNEDWSEVGAIGGHSAAVRGLAWSPGGEYLISAGLDQTTRIHSELPGSTDASHSVWHEIGRPQVHGYDLIGVESLDVLRFVSIADEKVARVFEAPREFVDVVNNLGVAHLAIEEGERPRAATVPPLGLSNKATSEVDPQLAGPSSSYDIARTKRRPFEGELTSVTLWPEIEKVFGHGYESIALAVSSSRTLVATACKATSPEHAVIRVYDTAKWQPVGQPLAGHALTVTRIAFSPDDRYVLSVSRDRSWRLFERKDEDGYVPVTADKTHSRIIWDCAWAPGGDIFATASRDKTVRVWHPTDSDKSRIWTAVTTIKTADAATAVAFAPREFDSRQRLAVGLESGQILIYSSPQSGASSWRLDLTIDSRTAHVDQIHHLIWRPYGSNATMQLASCSEDSTLKVLTVHIAMG